MTEVIGVRFKRLGKIYYFDNAGIDIEVGDKVIVGTSRGTEAGTVVITGKKIDKEDASFFKPIKNVLRVANAEDLKIIEDNIKKEKEAFDICLQKINKHRLNMKLINVECTFDSSKILFYFTADGRVDFRDLVKDLASVFRTRIELRQIGVRDEAKFVGGLGICGRATCCVSHIDEFEPVSINMAKDQGLSLNPSKISGSCGRLMCCLKHEQDGYECLLKDTPQVESIVDTPEGRGTVMSVSVLKGQCGVKLDDSTDAQKFFCCKQCKVIKKPKIKRELGSKEELFEIAKFTED